MSNWTDELRAKAISMYTEADPTPETNVEILKEIADELGEGFTVNGVRAILMQGKVYKSAASAGPATKKASGEKAEGTKRISKETQLAELRAAIEAHGAGVDEDILSKLTGKAAAYFTAVLKK